MVNRQFANIEKLSIDDMAGRLWAGKADFFAIWKEKKTVLIFSDFFTTFNSQFYDIGFLTIWEVKKLIFIFLHFKTTAP